MKALTICQPYAHLIVIGEKLVENRTWGTSYRGHLAIHAGKSRKYLDYGDEDKYPDMVFGAIVGAVWLGNCIEQRNIKGFVQRFPEESWLLDHEHVEGPTCWVLTHVTRLSSPIPYRGERGLFDIPEDVIQQMREAVTP